VAYDTHGGIAGGEGARLGLVTVTTQMAAPHPDRAPAPPTVQPARAPTRPGLVVIILSSCGIVASIMQTLVVPLIPELGTLLHSSAANASWVLTATLLSGAIFTPVSGRLGDMYGKRRILLICLSLLVVGSVVSALTSALSLMILGRVLQGAAMGAIPLGISIMRDTLPADRLDAAISLMSSTLGIGGAIGLPVAAFVAQHSDWHVLFWFSGGLGAVSVALIAFFVPESPLRTGGRFDGPGAAGLVVGLLCLLLPISKGGDWGWTSPLTLGLFVAAIVVLTGWGLFELRTPEALVDLRVAARRPVLLTNLASVAVGAAMYSAILIPPQLLQLPRSTGFGLGQSMVVAGLCLAPSGLVMLVVSPLAGRLSHHRGPKVTLRAGATVIAAGSLLAILLMGSVWEIVLISAIIGAGTGLAYSAMPALIMRSVPVTETAAANGLNALMRSLGTSTAAALLSAVLAHVTVTVAGREFPSRQGFQLAFALAAGAVLVGLLLTAFLPGRRSELPGRAIPVADPAE
jgi:MFS family permease